MEQPKHIAFIMDGNRRWAKQRGLPIQNGHQEGANVLEKVVAHATKLGIPYVTFWAFSTENWQRSKIEVALLMQVFRWSLASPMITRLKEKHVRIQLLGDLEKFPEDIQKEMKQLIAGTKDNTAITANIALNYGGRAEILRAMKEMLANHVQDISEENFEKFLYTTGQPDPDIVIRTGGAQRTSGFLTWQSAYSEWFFTETLWPDFSEKEFDIMLAEFHNRERRFGR